MQKDLKIGMLIGLGVVIASVIWLSMKSPWSQRLHNELSPMATAPQPQEIVIPAALEANSITVAQTLPAVVTPQTPSDANISGIEPDLTIYEKPEKITTQRFHIVTRGETLSGISKKYYGTAKMWQKIVDANPQVIKDANNLRTGVKLIIPE